MGLLKTANSTALSWVNTEAAPYPSGYVPVMALAQNHIHFLDVPGVPAGSADIFVIHCTCVWPLCGYMVYLMSHLADSYFQPQAQAYPLPNGSAFPATFGQTASFFQQNNTVRVLLCVPAHLLTVVV